MALFAWSYLLCFLALLLLLLLVLVLHWPRARAWTKWHRTSEEEPKLICKPTTLSKYLRRHCGFLFKFRRGTWLIADPHLQTLSGLLWGQREDTVQFMRENLLLRDGGTVALDWAVGKGVGERAVKKRRWDSRGSLGCFTSSAPVFIVIPQPWTRATPHSNALIRQAVCHGFHAVVFNPRGSAGCPLSTARLTEFGDPADLKQVVDYVHSCHPSSVLVAVSEGSSSGILLSYLGECGSGTPLTAAAAISPVLLGQLWFETVRSSIYRWGTLFQRKLQLCRYASSFRTVLDVDRVLSSSSLRDFEETLFCASSQSGAQRGSRSTPNVLNSGLRPGPHRALGVEPSGTWSLGERAHPAKDWDGYWERNEPLRDADEVAVPVLCICSRDDPILPPASTLPITLFQSNPYFFLALTEKGGHCGFNVGDKEGEKSKNEEVGRGCWSHTAVLGFFRVVVDFLKGEEQDLGISAGSSGEYHLFGQRNSSSSTVPPHRRSTVLRRPQGNVQSSTDAEDVNFIWKRSNTR